MAISRRSVQRQAEDPISPTAPTMYVCRPKLLLVWRLLTHWFHSERVIDKYK